MISVTLPWQATLKTHYLPQFSRQRKSLEQKGPFPIFSECGCVWPDRLKPYENPDEPFSKEPFDKYWKRAKTLVGRLDSQVIEQWIYRHWTQSPYSYICLDDLTSRLETWSTDDILAVLTRLNSQDDEAEIEAGEDYFGAWSSEPKETMERTGTWNIPPIILANAPGFLELDGTLVKQKHCLIEGHNRFRYLNYMNSRGRGDTKHFVWIIENPEGV